MREHLLGLSIYVFERTRRRVDGLRDEEYFWEPVAGCWSVRVDSDGGATADWYPNPSVAPVTTVAWRLWHLTDCYGAARNERWLCGSSGWDDDRTAPQPNAAAALAALEGASTWWHELLGSLTDEELATPLGPIAGPYADQDKAGFVLHQLDEMIHHGAEIGVLRDLYRCH